LVSLPPLHLNFDMNINRATLQDCHKATGTVVVIDVLRAFTTAAYAFDAGAQDITLVSTIKQAFALKKQMPGALLMGEADGLPILDFDLSNSPAELEAYDLRGRRLIQRTTSGTQGVVRSTQADTLLTSSLVCASATARYIQRTNPVSLTFVISGHRPGGWGDEDAACADYIEAQLSGNKPNTEQIFERVRKSPPGQKFSDPLQPDFKEADLEYSLKMDRFGFAMLVERSNGLLVMKAVE
jgi:2-phosphosulfolactate phosphatase